MTRWLAMVAAPLALGVAVDAVAQKAEPQTAAASLHLYLAKGKPNACGEGCSEWIAVEGAFDQGAADRVRAFLERHAARKLPVYFHSPGGAGGAALAIGRQIRWLGITTGVARTVPRVCTSAADRSPACAAAKRSGVPVAADWRPDGICNSACVWALLGGKVRHVPPGARLGVHSGKMNPKRGLSNDLVQQLSPQQYEAAQKNNMARILASTRRYMREMDIDPALLDVSLKVPHDNIHYLSRDQIAAFGIDAREFAETPWFFSEFANGSRNVSKWIVEAAGAERERRRVSVVVLRCVGAQHVTIQYVRSLAIGEAGQLVGATFGKLKPTLYLKGRAARMNAFDTGTLFVSGTIQVPFEDVEAAAAAEAIDVSEAGHTRTEQDRDLKLSTHGLAKSLKILREKCAELAAKWPERGKR